MTTTETAERELTRENIAALRKAKYAVLFYRPDQSEGVEWGIRVGTEVRMDNGEAEKQMLRIHRDGFWTRTRLDEHQADFIHVMNADPAHCQISRLSDWHGGDVLYASCLVYRSEPHVSSVFNTLRAGDSIGIRFVAGNNTENYRKVGYHADECYLRVFRKGKPVAEFLLDFYVGPDNTARFVR